MTAERREPGSYVEPENDIVFLLCENVVWISGYGGAGKSTIAKHLQRERGYTRCDLGPWLRKLYKEEERKLESELLSRSDNPCKLGFLTSLKILWHAFDS